MTSRRRLIAFAVSFVLGAAGIFLKAEEKVPVDALPETSALKVPVFDKLACLNEVQLVNVRTDPHNGAASAFANCLKEIGKKTEPLQLTKEETRIAFLSVLAHSMAPYGSSHSVSLKDLLLDKSMDCDNYAILTGHFNKILEDSTSNLNFAGFDGGAVGNHAQLFVDSEKGLLLDPTIGLVARIGFDDVLRGKPLNSQQVIVFRQHDNEDLDTFSMTVYGAILQGKYKPSDLLYFFRSIDDYLRFSDQIAPLWRDDLDDLILRFPTPGAKALRKNLTNQKHLTN